jgi:hypothetical protein
LAVLLDELSDFIDNGDVDQMLPEYAYNLGVIRAKIEAVGIGLLG